MSGTMLREIDAAHGEGGGQLVRTAVAVAALTRTPLRLTRMRAARAKPGLAAQHVTAVRAVAGICGGTVDGLAIGAQDITFHPGPLRGGAYEFDVGTAGSVPLVLQALLPAMVASGHRYAVRLIGGTDVWAAPPLDYIAHVLFPLIARLGARVALRCVRRGYYPRGGGIVEVQVEPHPLTPHAYDAPGLALGVRGISHGARLPAHVPQRMREAAMAEVAGRCPAQIDAVVLDPAQAAGPGGAIVMWAECERTVLGAGRVARRGVPAETLGRDTGAALAAELAAGATLDVHAADQMLVYFALCGGGSFLAREVSLHAETTMWLLEQMLPVCHACTRHGPLVRVVARASK